MTPVRGAGSSDPADQAQADQAHGDHADAKSIDVAALAERVYRLMCREVRTDRARGASLFGTRT